MKIRTDTDGFTLLLESAEEAVWLAEQTTEAAEDFADMEPGAVIALLIPAGEFKWEDFALPGLFDTDWDDPEVN